MKIKPKIYARVLVDVMMSKKNAGNEKKIVDNFLKLLKKNVDVKNATEIIRLAEVFILQKTGNKKITLETARDIGRKNIFKEIESDLSAPLETPLSFGINDSPGRFESGHSSYVKRLVPNSLD